MNLDIQTFNSEDKALFIAVFLSIQSNRILLDKYEEQVN
jgi:hypothetical protein